MPIPKLEITNPQALEIISKIKSGEIFIPIIAWFKKYRWYFYTLAIITVLIFALSIGKKLSEKTPTPVFTPPEIQTPQQQEDSIVKSNYSNLRETIQNLNTDLPDPFIPVFDNAINLEESTIN